MTAPRLPPLSAIRSFAAAARHQSFRLAAAELGVTPSAVSHQVKALEVWIGAPLFVRVGRDVHLSATGGFVAAKVMEAFELLAQSLDSARREASETTLRISALPLFTQAWPRVHDIEVKHIVDILGRLNVGAFSFEAANPRHEHEWTSWRDAKLPDDVIMIPGIITQSNVMVEHPESVAQRLERWVDAFGVERVIAGTDCGFASFAGNDEIHETIVWAKFDALVKGTQIASGAARSKRRTAQRA